MIKKILGSKLFYIIFSLIASFCVWLYVVNVENSVTTKDITGIIVTYVGEDGILDDRSLMIVDGKDITVNLTIMGKRSILSKLNRDNITVLVDVSDITRTGNYNLGYEIKFPADIATKDLAVITRSVNNIYFSIAKMDSKSVEVRGVLEGSVAEGYLAQDFQFDHETLEIHGAENELAQVSYVLVELNRTNLTKTVTETLPFVLIGYDDRELTDLDITPEVTEIQVTLPIVQTKQIPLDITIQEGGGATNDNLAYSITPNYVQVSGDAETLSGINSISLGTVDLSKILNNTTLTMPIILPNGIENLSGEVEATVNLELTGLETKTIVATNIQLINVPEVFTATSVTQALQVLVRADKDTLELINESNIRVVADMSSYSQATGQYSVPVEVYIDISSSAGIVNDYSITVLISENDGESEAAQAATNTG